MAGKSFIFNDLGARLREGETLPRKERKQKWEKNAEK
jgi:hypothetical protein